jgi:hypothetical protein
MATNQKFSFSSIKLFTALLLIILSSNSCKKSGQSEDNDYINMPKNLKKVMTEPLRQTCIETWWVTENWAGDQLISTSRELMYSICFTPSDGSNGGGGSGTNAPPINVDVIPDSLKKKFPCVYPLLEGLSAHAAVNELLQPFIAATPGADGVHPTLFWMVDPNLPFTLNGQSGTTTFGVTIPNYENKSLNSAIYLNSQMLTLSSPALIETVMVHEMIHAYFNTLTTFAGYGVINDNDKPLLERISYFAKKSADDNGRDHLTILASYVDKIALAVKDNDPQPDNKSLQDYYKLAIGGLYNDGKVASPDFGPTFQTLLNSINSTYNFTITIDNASHMVNSQKKVPPPYRVKCLN